MIGEVVTKSPLRMDGQTEFPEEPRFGRDVEIKIPRGDLNTAPVPRVDLDGRPYPRQPRGGQVVQGDFSPSDFPHFRPPAPYGQRLVFVVLEGGPLDGQEIEIGSNAHEYLGQVPVDPATVEPFEFDAEAHRRGKPNVVRGQFDTVAYARTNDKTADGLRIYRFRAPTASAVQG